MRWIGVLIVFAACSEGGTAIPDAVEVPDAPTPVPGLYVNWGADPALPGRVTDKITVDHAVFRIASLEIVGDSTGGTTRARYALTWNNESRPPAEQFGDALPGLYSKIGIRLSPIDADPSYEIRGTWHDERDGRDWRYEIEDNIGLRIDVDCEAMLPVAGSAEINVDLDLEDVLSTIEFAELEEDDGTLTLRPPDQQIFELRTELADAFSVRK